MRCYLCTAILFLFCLPLSGNVSGQEASTLVITTIAGTRVPGLAGDGELATQAKLAFPSDVAVDTKGNVYIADNGNHRVRRLGRDGIITTIAGSTGFQSANGCDVDVSGNVYIADARNQRVRRVRGDGIITTIAGTGTAGYGGDGGPAIQAALNIPKDVAVDREGNVYIADFYNHRVRRVGGDGIITTIAGTGMPGYGGDGGPAIQANLRGPNGITVDAKGNVYIADTGNDRIRRVGVDGIIATVAGNGTWGFAGDRGLATRATLAGPCGIVVDPGGTMYISDSYNNRIRRVGVDGIITTVAGNGTRGFKGDGGLATLAALSTPMGIAIDTNTWAVYIADTFNHRIRRIRLLSSTAPSLR